MRVTASLIDFAFKGCIGSISLGITPFKVGEVLPDPDSFNQYPHDMTARWGTLTLAFHNDELNQIYWNNICSLSNKGADLLLGDWQREAAERETGYSISFSEKGVVVMRLESSKVEMCFNRYTDRLLSLQLGMNKIPPSTSWSC